MVRPLQACLSVLLRHCLLRRGGQHCGYLLKGGRVKPLTSDQIMSWLNLSYVYSKQTRILKISIKNFMGFRNVRKSIETSDDISVATVTHRIL